MNYSYIGPEGQIKNPERNEGYLCPEWSNIAVIHTRRSLSLFDDDLVSKNKVEIKSCVNYLSNPVCQQ